MSGQMVGPAVGGALGSLWDWRVAMAVAGGIGLAVALVCVASGRRERSPRSDADGSPTERPEVASAPPLPTSRLELTALAAVPFATFFSIAGLVQTLVPVIGDRELGLASSTIGIAIAAGAAVRFVTAWATGVGSDRLSRKAMLVPSLAVMALGAGALTLPAAGVSWGVAIVLLAAGSSGISVAAAALADRVSAARLGHELGLFRLVGDLGLLAGPVVCGFLYQESGRAAGGAAAAGVLVAATLVALVWLREPERPPRPEDPVQIPIA
jgi:predicted MFS family arabinose efflux permease